MMRQAPILVIPAAKSKQNFVVPYPDPMVGRPPTKPTSFSIDVHMLDVVVASVDHAGGSGDKDYQTSHKGPVG